MKLRKSSILKRHKNIVCVGASLFDSENLAEDTKPTNQVKDTASASLQSAVLGSFISLKVNKTSISRFYHKFVPRVIYNMKTAYFYHYEENTKVQITVNYNDSFVTKVLNFERNMTDTLTSFLDRLERKLSLVYSRKKKRKAAAVEQMDEVDEHKFDLCMFLNNEQVPETLLFEDIFQSNFNGSLKLRISNDDYDVLLNSPLIQKMVLPKLLYVGQTVYPETFDSKETDIFASEFFWFKAKESEKKVQWQECSNGFFYKIVENDLGFHLKLTCIPKLNEKVGPIVEVISKTPVEEFENLNEIRKRHEFTKEKTNSDEFRIVTYNILADMYVKTKEAKSEIFCFCDPVYLEYPYRKILLNFELEGYNADILCLQEVERKLYKDNSMLFDYWGFESLYHEKVEMKVGCAILYKKDKFKCLETCQYTLANEILYSELFNDIQLQIKHNKKLLSSLKNVTSQLQGTVLEAANNNILLIGNVHFYYHPSADHIRLLQGISSVRILLNKREKMKIKYPGKKLSVILCGDFNSSPDSGIHQLLCEGSVDSNHVDWKSRDDELITDVSETHPLKMKSCYDNKIFTNYIATFKDCLDYIYYQTDYLELVQTVPVPSEEVLSRFLGIPSKFFPSDHVALISDLKFKNEG